MTQAQLVKRVEELEREMQEVRSQLAGVSGKPLTSRDFIGMFHNDADFQQAMKLGAAYRHSLRPSNGRRKAKKK